MEHLVAEVNALRASQISESTRSLYQNSTVRMLSWLFHNKPAVLSDAFLDGVADKAKGPTKEYILSILGPPAKLEQPPLKFDTFQSSDFMLWIVSLRREDGTSPANASAPLQAVLFNQCSCKYWRTPESSRPSQNSTLLSHPHQAQLNVVSLTRMRFTAGEENCISFRKISRSRLDQP